MKKRRRKRRPRKKKYAVGIRRAAGRENAWELVHPPCAQQREDDLAEVQEMLAAGEDEVATDELRWLLSECPDMIEAHKLLGVLALEADDLRLARGHFGHAFRIGLAALPEDGFSGTLPYELEGNASLHEAGKGLAHALRGLGKPKLARRVIAQMLELDPSDPLGVRAWLEGE